MRVHNILTSVLITGMLNFNVVLGQNEVARAIFLTWENLGIVNEGMLNFYVSRFKTRARRSCDDDQLWPEGVAAWGQIMAKQCIRTVMNSTRPLSNWYWLFTDAAIVDAYVDTYCPKITPLRACVTDFTRPGERCLTPAEREIKNDVEEIIFSALEFVCEDNGRRLKELAAAKSVSCVVSRYEDLAACLQPPKLNQNILLGNSCPYVTTKQYGEFKKLQRCTVDVLRTCRNQSVADFVNDLGNTWAAIWPIPSA